MNNTININIKENGTDTIIINYGESKIAIKNASLECTSDTINFVEDSSESTPANRPSVCTAKISSKEEDPNKRYGIFNTYILNSIEDTDEFCEMFNHDNNYTNRDGIRLSLGDKIVINDGRYNITWIVMGFDLEHNRIASDGITYDNGYGIFLMPESNIEDMQWNVYKNNYGGYLNSDIHKYINGPLCNSMKRILDNHMVSRKVLLEISYENYHCMWTESYMTLMSLFQMENGINHRNAIGEATYKFPILNFTKIGKLTSYSNFWLRDYDEDWGYSIAYDDNLKNIDPDYFENYLNYFNGVRPIMCIR